MHYTPNIITKSLKNANFEYSAPKQNSKTKVQISGKFPIDIVYTWVNGSDPDWLSNKSYYLEQNHIRLKPLTDASRYVDIGELMYSLRSIHLNIPWYNKIFIVTDNQIPNWINSSHEKIQFVNHTAIIPKQYLPTFNSNTIEFYLHRIPGLSEHFIYFNDDVFIAKKSKRSVFFTKDGLPYFPVCECDWGKKENRIEKYQHRNKNDMGSIQYRLISFHSYDSFYKKFNKPINMTSVHSYMPLTKTLMGVIWKHFQDELLHVSSHRFRDYTDINLPLMAIFVGCGLGFAVPNTDPNASFLIILDATISRSLRKLDLSVYTSFCLNSGERTVHFSRKRARVFLERVFRQKSPYELK